MLKNGAIVRWAGTAVWIYLAYTETGIWTSSILIMLAIAIEIIAHLLRLLMTKDHDR